MTTSFCCEAAQVLGVPESKIASWGGELPGFGPVAVARVMTRREEWRMRKHGTLKPRPMERGLENGK